MDIDIDLPPNFDPKQYFGNIVRASMIQNGEIKKHPAGYYFQSMPVDPISGLAAIPYNEAEDHGFMKIDFLHLKVLDSFKSKQEMRELLEEEPDWTILQDREQYPKLFQLSRHYNIVNAIVPLSIEDLADCVAIIRPGKLTLKEEYLNAPRAQRKELRKFLYTKPTDGGYYFKKSHAHAYATTIVLQLLLIELGRL